MWPFRRSTTNAQDRKLLWEHQERLQRLEIQCRELADQLSQLQGHHLKLRKQFDGSKGGRPVQGSHPGQLSLDQVPHGDKVALRRILSAAPGGLRAHLEDSRSNNA